jgi:hypothetical protein
MGSDMNLNDTHLVLLSAAAQREDNLLIMPDELPGKTGEKVGEELSREFEPTARAIWN